MSGIAWVGDYGCAEDGEWEIRYFTSGFDHTQQSPSSVPVSGPAARRKFVVPHAADDQGAEEKRAEDELAAYSKQLKERPIVCRVLEQLTRLSAGKLGMPSALQAYYEIVSGFAQCGEAQQRYLLTLPPAGLFQAALRHLHRFTTHSAIDLPRRHALPVLQLLVTLSKSPALSAEDKEIAHGPKFILPVLALCDGSSPELAALCKSILLGLCVTVDGSVSVMQLLCQRIRSPQIFFKHLKPYFQAYKMVLAIADDWAEKRVASGMDMLVDAVLSQQLFFRFQEHCIEYTLRLAKYVPRVMEYILNTEKGSGFLREIDAWCREWEAKPPAVEKHLMVRAKAAKEGKTVHYKPQRPNPPASYGAYAENWARREQRSMSSRLLKKMAPILEAAKDGVDPAQVRMEGGDCYDSDDDPYQLIGDCISVKWDKARYVGVLTSYDPDDHTHACHYTDGDIKHYPLGFCAMEKHNGGDFFFVDPPDPADIAGGQWKGLSAMPIKPPKGTIPGQQHGVKAASGAGVIGAALFEDELS